MCAIFGTTDLTNSGNEFMAYAMKSMLHRGPDSQQNFEISNYLVGHNRLRILDKTNLSDQPIVDSSNGSWMVFNGEIFNFIELANEYNILKYTSDTIVLFQLLQNYGVTILNRLNGYFSIAWFDGNKLYLIRDRFGEKPLYYSIVSGNLYFASEIRAFKFFPLEIDEDYVDESYGDSIIMDFDHRTFYKSVMSVKPGSYLSVCKNNSVSQNIWYHGRDFSFNSPKTYQEFYNVFISLLKNSVAIRTRSDVPIAISLSGGIDSTALYLILKELNIGTSVTPITFVHKSDSTSELGSVEKVTSFFRDELKIVENEISYDFKALEDSISSVEYPIWGASSIAFNALYRSVRESGFIVIIEGHASDELFGGYPHFVEQKVLDEIRSLRIMSSFKFYKLYCSVLNPNIGQKQVNYIKLFLKSFFSRKSFRSLLQESFRKSILPIVLRCFDRVSMYNSVESRSPFLDYRIVELLSSVPVDFLISSKGTKRPLRDFISKSGFDFVSKNNVKMGFSVDLTSLQFSKESEFRWSDYAKTWVKKNER